jgi:IclR family KDG regulon transcriptional repressor
VSRATGSRSRTTTGSLGRGLDCLLVLADSNGALSVSELAQSLNIPVSTVYRLLRPLEKRGLVDRTVDDKRVLGLDVLKLCRSASIRYGQDISGVARPTMMALAEATRETVILTVARGFESVCVDSIESPHPVRLSFEKGRIQPIYAGASAKILLAFSDPAFQEEVISECHGLVYSHGQVIDGNQLRQELSRVREQGMIVTASEVDDGAVAVAAPVLTAKERLVAGLSIAGPENRFREDRLPELVDMVVSAAQQISQAYDSATLR